MHPEALRLLNRLGHDTSGLRSKSWDEFTAAVPFHQIITVCNKAADEICPAIPGKPAKMHWDIADPTSVVGTQMQMEAAFRETYDMLSQRILVLIRR